MTQQNSTANHLATDDIGRLFAKFAVPMAIAMLINGLYNLVDAFFIARYVGPAGMAGVSIVFPLQMIIIALAGMVSNGVSAIVSRRFGAGQLSEANQVVANAAFMLLLMAIVIPILMLWFMPTLLRGLGVTEELWPYAEGYLRPIISASILTFMLSLIMDLLRAEGKMGGLFAIIVLSALSNTLLDALLIAGLGWGVQGAAIATLTAQALGLLLGLLFFFKGQTKLDLPRPTFKPVSTVIGEILALGSPVLLSYLGVALITGLVNYTLAHSGHQHLPVLIGAYGVLGRISIFTIMPLIAMSNACQTIAAFNYGAGLTERVKGTVKIGIVASTTYLSIIAAIMLLLPAQVMAIFSDNQALITQGEQIAQVMYLGLPLAGIGTMAIAMFQAIGHARHAVLLSSVKVYLLLLPLILLVPSLLGTDAIWYAFPLADLIVFILVVVLVRRYFRRWF